jgi:protein TonB
MRIEPEGEHIFVSEAVAKSLLIQKVEPIFKNPPMAARVFATVVVHFELGKLGEVLCPRIISGPKLLQQPVLDAVRKYKFKPYLLNGEATVVGTTISVTVSNE